ncbi:hypothetical protein [Cognatishimia sp. F0-27]|uniref:hypothetical protein n=1 Tax=Cognatishimia sp. F0-27 TaxID=2816855 RepID=UPI001D0CC361|nr:hypothetical protein [Cognatishimia sp. F0-27]MCC1491775.1 hypothetical protein [Cognatishimia sp. F0-27]
MMPGQQVVETDMQAAGARMTRRSFAPVSTTGSLDDRPGRHRPAVFLERQTYRRRRLADGARALPVLGLLLWFLPMVWSAKENGVQATHALIYIFLIWTGLVALSAGVLLALRHTERQDAEVLMGPDQTVQPRRSKARPDSPQEAGERG